MAKAAIASIQLARFDRLREPGSVPEGQAPGTVFCNVDKTGDHTIEFAMSYLLERSDGDWRILSYISRTNQKAEMAKEGLL